MVKLVIKTISFAAFFFIVSCAQPQGSLPKYNQQLSIEEQKIQNQLNF